MKYPIKISMRTELMPIIILGIVWVLSGYFYNNFPEIVVSHWNISGRADGFSGRAGGAFAIPTMMTVMYVMFVALPLLDPKKDRYPEFEKYYRLFRTAILSLLGFVYIVAGLYNLGVNVDIGKTVSLSVGTLMIVMGNYMGKIKKNSFVGIKTPWTLSSETVWNKTHRAGGWMFAIYGLVIMATPYVPESVGMAMFAGGTILATAGTMGYSYWIYSRENRYNQTHENMAKNKRKPQS